MNTVRSEWGLSVLRDAAQLPGALVRLVDRLLRG
jgi:hypothetical protein